MDRREKILTCIDPVTQLGIEIGALNKPIVTPEMGNIRYVDHATTEELRQKYAADPNVETEKIVEVSYVWGEKRLLELVKDTRFDYVIASHVIEHVPDLIGWLKEIHAVLKPGGILSLAIPDKRYFFDYLRQPTQPPDAVDAYLRNQRKPGPRQVFEFFSLESRWQGHSTWGQDPSFRSEDVVRIGSEAEAWQATSQSFASGVYCDVHCWVFTPTSFVELVRTLIKINLFDFKILKFYPSAGCEFHVTLEALDLTKAEEDRQQIQLASLAEIDLEEPDQSPALEEVQSAELLQAKIDQIHQIHLRTTELEQERQRSELLQAEFEHLQSDLENRDHEISAMRSSKFWLLRGKWFSIKRAIGIRGE